MRKKKHREVEEIELNINSLMDLLMVLLTFLILCAAFNQFAILSASTPAISPATDIKDVPKETEKKVVIYLRIKKTEFKITGQGNIGEENEKAINHILPKNGENYDFKAVSLILSDLKAKYPASDTVMILPDEGISYETIVKAMDASRTKALLTLDKDAQKNILFPNAVISGMIE